MTVPLYLDRADAGMAFVYVQNPTGGVFAGDALDLRVAAGPGARVHVTTQSATKLYRMDGGRAVQELCFSVAERAYLEYVPDALIPQAGAELAQTTLVDLEHSGLLGKRDYLTSLLVVAPERDPEELAARLDATFAADSDLLVAAGALPNGSGAVARMLTGSAPQALRALLGAWRVARDHVIGLPLPAVRK